jgi:hypothetical protein
LYAARFRLENLMFHRSDYAAGAARKNRRSFRAEPLARPETWELIYRITEGRRSSAIFLLRMPIDSGPACGQILPVAAKLLPGRDRIGVLPETDSGNTGGVFGGRIALLHSGRRLAS